MGHMRQSLRGNRTNVPSMNGPMPAICRRIAWRRVTNRFLMGFVLLLGLSY